MKIGKSHLIVILLGALSAVFFLGGVANAGPVTPGGTTWDFKITGSMLGWASLTFIQPDPAVIGGTVSGYIIAIPAAGNKGGSSHTITFGCTSLSGEWEANGIKNEFVGYLYNPPNDTVRMDITSFSGGIAGSGNNQKFVVAGTMADGKVTLTGQPVVLNQDLTGVWTINKTAQGSAQFTEILGATNQGNNLYFLSGEAADRCVAGCGALSWGNQFNVALTEYPMPASNICSDVDPTTSTYTGSAAVGTLNVLTQPYPYRSSILKGTQQGQGSLPGATMQVLCQ